MREIKLTAKSVYGNDPIYPACETGKLLLALTRKRTFDFTDIVNIRNLGYQIELSGHVPPDLMAVLV